MLWWLIRCRDARGPGAGGGDPIVDSGRTAATSACSGRAS
jgi:hypothetical protein